MSSTGAAARRGRWRRPLLIAAVIILIVGAFGAGAVLVADRGGQPQYAISVFLTADAGPDRKAAIASALNGLHPVDGVAFETREQAWAKFRVTFKDQPTLIASSSPADMPESFRLAVRVGAFDCALLAPVRELPGIDEITVFQQTAGGRPATEVKC